MKDSFCYSFRFCCDPYFNEARELESLKRFCREAEIDDVSVFCNVEELNTGHTTPDEQEIYLALLKNVRKAVAPQGVTVSVNPWHSLMHADLGKPIGLRDGDRPAHAERPPGRSLQQPGDAGEPADQHHQQQVAGAEQQPAELAEQEGHRHPAAASA